MRWQSFGFLSLLIILAQVLITGCAEPTATEEAEYKLVWHDEFNGPAGGSPDPDRWGYDIGTDWGNNQLEYDTDRRENVSTDGQGNLAIIARQENYINRGYTSARIVTRDKFEPVYGRFEARIRMPTGQGLWPAFWLLGVDYETLGWPDCGEIDIMEYRGQEPSLVHGSLHGPGYSGGNAITRSLDTGSNRLDTDFHVYAVEWRDDSIMWFFDEINYHTVRRGEQNGDWPFDRPFYMILNVAVGGNFVGPPNQNTVFPQKMLIDWVRVYQEEE